MEQGSVKTSETNKCDYSELQEASTSEPQESTCLSCQQEFSKTSLYRCKSCTSITSVSNAYCEQMFYCRMCIVSHLRRNDDIFDHRGHSPAECEYHRNLFFHFCETCRVLFCPECTETHSIHYFHSLPSKTSEVRRQIFECLSKNESLLKPLKHKEHIFQLSFNRKIKVADALAQDKLTSTLQEVRKSTFIHCQ